MPKREHPERAIKDYPRKPLKDYAGKLPPFDNEKEARVYIKGQWGITKEADVQKLLKWYIPTLYPCGCPDDWSDQRYGLNNRLQYDCGSFYRCSNCGEERNPDGSKHKRHYVSDVDTVKEIKADIEQLSLLEWKEERD